jgi:hypothetical protein
MTRLLKILEKFLGFRPGLCQIIVNFHHSRQPHMRGKYIPNFMGRESI